MLKREGENPRRVRAEQLAAMNGSRAPVLAIVNARLSRYHARAGYQVEISSDLRNELRGF